MTRILDIVQKFFPEVTQVVDATRNQSIEVTARDLTTAAKKDHKTCAMAVACKRAMHLDGVIISRTTAYLIKDKKARRFLLPSSVEHEIVSFDRGAGFAAGHYQLNKVSAAKKLGSQNGGHGPHTGSGKPKRFRHMTTGVRTVLGGEQPEA